MTFAGRVVVTVVLYQCFSNFVRLRPGKFFFTYLLCLIIPTLSTIFIAQFGLIINLAFPVLEWDNEVRVIKQSLASLITVMFGMVLAIIPITIIMSMKINNLNVFVSIVTICLILLDIALFYYIKQRGVKKFETL